MEYLKAFMVGGMLCLIGQILIDKTKLTPARILVGYVVAGGNAGNATKGGFYGGELHQQRFYVLAGCNV